MKFRYDINGLRAIAVIAVALFHYNPVWVPGGFAGVDVFFVISGFLMTRIVFTGLEANSFSLFEFYTARARRIIPPLIFLCFGCLLMAFFFFFDDAYENVVKHVIASLGFFSNITYWKEAGYFDVSSSEKLLLHTWSLAVEWQFYIIYPIVLVFLNKLFSLNKLKKIIVLGTIFGFLLSVFATIHSPNAAYYFLPTRAWELMMGGVAFIYQPSLLVKNKKISGGVGLALIFSAYFFVSSGTPWPGYAALLPVLGTYLIIISNQQFNVVINSAFFQLIGKMSYSIYLWHWPVAKFIEYQYLRFDFLLYLFFTLVLSCFSYFLFEKYKNRIFVSFVFVSMVSLTFLNVKKDETHSYEYKIFKSGIDKSYHVDTFSKEKWQEDKRKKVLVVGDSHSKRWGAVLANSYPDIAFNVISGLLCGLKVVNDKVEINLLKGASKKECNFSKMILNDQDMRSSYDLIILASFRPFSYTSNQWRFDLPNLFGEKKWLVLGNYYQLDRGMSCKNMAIYSKKNCLIKSSYPESKESYRDEVYYKRFDWNKSEYFNLIDSVCSFNKDKCPYQYKGYRMMDDFNHHHTFFIQYLIKLSKNDFDKMLYEN